MLREKEDEFRQTPVSTRPGRVAKAKIEFMKDNKEKFGQMLRNDDGIDENVKAFYDQACKQRDVGKYAR